MYSRPCSSQTRQPDERVIRLGRSGSGDPKTVSGRLLPVEVNPGMCSVMVPRALKSAELERSKPRRILPIAPQPNPSSTTTPDQLAGSSQTVGEHLIDQQVEPDLLTRPELTPVRRSEGHGETVPGICAGPAADNLIGHARGSFHSTNDKLSGCRRDDQYPRANLLLRDPDIQLNPVGVNFIRLVVQPERRRCGIPNDQLGFGHFDRHMQSRITPVHVSASRKFFRACIGLFTATVLVLVVELERLAGIEPLQAPVQYRCLGDLRGHRPGHQWTILHQRLKRSRRLAGASEPDRLLTASDLPAFDRRDVPFYCRAGLHLDSALRNPQIRYHRGRSRLEHSEDPKVPASAAQQIERNGFARAGDAWSHSSNQITGNVDQCA